MSFAFQLEPREFRDDFDPDTVARALRNLLARRTSPVVEPELVPAAPRRGRSFAEIQALLTQQDMARAAGVTQRTARKWDRTGRVPPGRLPALRKAARFKAETINRAARRRAAERNAAAGEGDRAATLAQVRRFGVRIQMRADMRVSSTWIEGDAAQTMPAVGYQLVDQVAGVLDDLLAGRTFDAAIGLVNRFFDEYFPAVNGVGTVHSIDIQPPRD